MKTNILHANLHTLYENFNTNFQAITRLAVESSSFDQFFANFKDYVDKKCRHWKVSDKNNHITEPLLATLIKYEGLSIHELSRSEALTLQTLSYLWHFLRKERWDELSPDFIIDLYQQVLILHGKFHPKVSTSHLHRLMKRWPSGLDDTIIATHECNKARIVQLLIERIEHHHAVQSKYIFPNGCNAKQKQQLVQRWWNSSHFQLTMAIKSPTTLNRYLGNSLTEENMNTLNEAFKKGIPFFITPYYISLLSTDGSYDDKTLRSYVIYSQALVNTYGHIKAWEKEDCIENGKPNVAGWLLPIGNNIHRRYPEVAILIPDSMGRACGGLCASCQRLYEFQNERFNFNLEQLKPKEEWPQKLKRLMDYFEEDTQLRDILITGGDAFMSQNATLRNLLNAILKMAQRKRDKNLTRPDGEKYAEIQRIRLGSRLPAYLPMRFNDELIEILREYKIRGQAIGIEQFFIQTHFQSPLEMTPEAEKAIRGIESAGWIVTNQLVFNVATSRRGHTAKLRHTLNRQGVLCYYTFTVKGFEENYDIFTPNSRSVQEQREEKTWGTLSTSQATKLSQTIYRSDQHIATYMEHFMRQQNLPFLATDRNVMNLPGIGKSMSFRTIGLLPDGKRVLEFEHDSTRLHSPIINHMGVIYISENKSIATYLRELETMGESYDDYATIWHYTVGKTQRCFDLFLYPPFHFNPTKQMTHLQVNLS